MGDASPIAYMNTQDIAKFAVKALSTPETVNRIFPLAGSRAWGAYEIIELCERLSGQNAKVSKMSMGLLRGAQRTARFFQWTQDLADRLAFVEVVAGGQPLDAPMDEVYQAFDISPKEITTLESYMEEYFGRIMKKLKELDYDQRRTRKRKAPF